MEMEINRSVLTSAGCVLGLRSYSMGVGGGSLNPTGAIAVLLLFVLFETFLKINRNTASGFLLYL